MSGPSSTSMASPPESAKDTVKPDTIPSIAVAAADAPTKPDLRSAPKDGAKPTSHAKVDSHSTTDSTFASSPTLVCADPVDQQKDGADLVEELNEGESRRSSAGSLRFENSRPGLPRGDSRGIDGHRIRNASPPPTKFRSHVAFDTTSPDVAKTSGITLSAGHNGYHAQRRSKTFIVGVDEHKYSEEALEWLLTAMVDDHDTVVCVRVIEKDVKPLQNAAYKEQAHQLLQWIIRKNKLDKAICIILEYQFGRLGPTFDAMVAVHQPSMLVVGTKGKSNQGMQGMWNTRHSFSKYCLEKASVPVVVVRPEDVRLKKKDKRSRDPTRNSYAKILENAGGVHESDLLDDKMLRATVTQLSSLDEASQVAKALCLPAEFDPTIKQYHRKTHKPPPAIVVGEAPSEGAADVSADKVLVNVNDSGAEDDDDDDDDDGDDDGGEDRNPTEEPLSDPVKLERLHKMEVGEAAALKKRNTGDLLDDDDPSKN